MKLPSLLVCVLLIVSYRKVQSQSTSAKLGSAPSSESSDIPTTAPPSTTIKCVNSWLKFRINNHDGKLFEEVNCKWVSMKKNRCNYDNVDTHCPETCGTCEIDTDSKVDFYFEEEYHTCEIVSKKLCLFNAISNACRATCNIFSAPPKELTDSPTIEPSYSPNAAPPSTMFNCQNSWLKFRIQDPDGKLFEHINCNWVSNNKKRCDYDNVGTHCPQTCGTCEIDTDSKVDFYFGQKYITCEIANEVSCRNSKIYNTCRATCGTYVSSSVPSSEPTPAPMPPPTTSPPTTPPPTTSPPTTSPPTLLPTKSPSDTDLPTTSSPMTSPPTTSPPTFACADSEFKFSTIDDVISKRHCKKLHCKQLGVPTHCPLLCGACTVCADSAIRIYDKPNFLTCATLIEKYTCDNEKTANTCRATCGRCVP